MSATAKTLIGFGIYMALTGLALVGAPNVLLGILRLPPTHEPWIRLLGMFMIIVAYYYYRTARSEVRDFFQATIHGRTVIGFFLVYLGLTSNEWVLILFAVGEWIGAALTWWTLRSSPAGRS